MDFPYPSKLLARVRGKHFDKWARGYAHHLLRQVRAPKVNGTRHLLFALCDHYEPLWGDANAATGQQRVTAWTAGYPALHDPFVDADGYKPRHSFFFPGEQYSPDYLSSLATLCQRGYGEVEVHLHHDGDTADTLRSDLLTTLDNFAQHGHLSRDAAGRKRYAFIHGNWCLANARADGRWCGVDNEIALLWETGCYADFTFPAAPNESQPNIVNQIYWPTGDLTQRRAYEHGTRASVGGVRNDRLLMIEGPLALAFEPGRIGRIETGDLHGGDPATARRVRTWVRQNIHVAGRPEWVFVKVHTHGAPERNAASLLGDGGHSMHSALRQFNDGHNWQLHYVTAREMYNIAIAAMENQHGNPNDFRDYRIAPPPVCTARA